MKAQQENIQIEIATLKNGKHVYDLDIDTDFFAAIPQDLITKGDAHIGMEIIKTDSMVQANFYIHGRVELVCDRSLKPFYHPIQSKETLYFKYADRNEAISEDTFLIKQDTPSLDLGQHIFEFIALEIPLKKIHPDLITQYDNSEGDILVYSSVNNSTETEDNNIDILDPRWEALRKLKEGK